MTNQNFSPFALCSASVKVLFFFLFSVFNLLLCFYNFIIELIFPAVFEIRYACFSFHADFFSALNTFNIFMAYFSASCSCFLFVVLPSLSVCVFLLKYVCVCCINMKLFVFFLTDRISVSFFSY